MKTTNVIALILAIVYGIGYIVFDEPIQKAGIFVCMNIWLAALLILGILRREE